MATKNISDLTPVETEFFNLVYRARSVEFNVESITKKDPKKQDEKRKVMKLVYKCIYDKEGLTAKDIHLNDFWNQELRVNHKYYKKRGKK